MEWITPRLLLCHVVQALVRYSEQFGDTLEAILKQLCYSPNRLHAGRACARHAHILVTKRTLILVLH